MYEKVCYYRDFFLYERLEGKPYAKESAHKSLEVIAEILERKLPCLSGKAPNLYGVARRIREGYLAKTRRLSWVRRLFGNVAKKERALHALCARIFPPPATFTSLPPEVLEQVCLFLSPVRDLGRLMRVSRALRDLIQARRPQFLLPFATRFGYSAGLGITPIAYVQLLFSELYEERREWCREIGMIFPAKPRMYDHSFDIETGLVTYVRSRPLDQIQEAIKRRKRDLLYSKNRYGKQHLQYYDRKIALLGGVAKACGLFSAAEFNAMGLKQ